MNGYTIRDATEADLQALAALHVQTFNETHGETPNGPTVGLRESQWRGFFADPGEGFCLVVERGDGKLLGFAKGIPYNAPEPLHLYPSGTFRFAAELNKIYLLRDHQGLGLGRRLLRQVVRRFLDQGLTSMLLFGDADNSSNGFYERMGAERLLDLEGNFHGGYGWRDLTDLTETSQSETR